MTGENEVESFVGFDAETGEQIVIGKRRGQSLHSPSGKDIRKTMRQKRLKREVEEIKEAQHDEMIRRVRR